MRLGLIELRRRPGRYLAVASAVGFIVALALILSALSDGLYLGATGAYRSTDADVYFFAPESAFQLGRSVVPADAVAEVKGSELVAAAGGFGTLQTAAVADDGTELLLSLLGADGPARPASITAGRFPSDGADEVLVDAQLERRGISIGSRIVVGSGAALTVVGVVADTRESGLEQPPRPAIYVNLLQRPRFSVTVVIQASGDTGGIVRASREVLKGLAPDVPPRFRTFAEIYATALGPRRFSMVLVGVFAGTALILAIAGVYGVMTYDVTGRRRELGVRVALGASRWQMLRLVLAQGLLTTAAGVVAGVVAAYALTGTLESLLYGITPTDPIAFGVVIATLMGVAAIACYLPARRATGADPMEALRLE